MSLSAELHRERRANPAAGSGDDDVFHGSSRRWGGGSRLAEAPSNIRALRTASPKPPAPTRSVAWPDAGRHDFYRAVIRIAEIQAHAAALPRDAALDRNAE